MAYAICSLSAISVWSKPNVKSEQLSQALFGDLLEIIDIRAKKWVKVRLESDQIIGWILREQVSALSIEDYERFKADFSVNLELFHPLLTEKKSFPIPFGSRLPLFDGLGFQLNGERFTFSGRAIVANERKTDPIILEKLGRKFLNAPYSPGGKTAIGIDPTGLAPVLFSSMGIALCKNIESQVQKGQDIYFVEEAKLGDLAFFQSKRTRLDHIGILLEGNQILHVDEKVRIDKIDHYGIYNTKAQRYTYELRTIKRVIPRPKPIIESASSSNEVDSSENQMTMF